MCVFDVDGWICSVLHQVHYLIVATVHVVAKAGCHVIHEVCVQVGISRATSILDSIFVVDYGVCCTCEWFIRACSYIATVLASTQQIIQLGHNPVTLVTSFDHDLKSNGFQRAAKGVLERITFEKPVSVR